jgi:maltoporin
MKTVKMLPLAMAVVAALCPISVLAQEFTQEQIDAIVAKAVDKALADRQAKIDAAANKKWTSSPTRRPPPPRRIWRFRSA